MAEYLKYLPKPLLDDIVNNRCIPFVGAGFSKNAELPRDMNMPDWNQLGQAIATEMNDYPFNNPIDVISAYAYEFSRSKLIEKFVELLLVTESKPGQVHDTFCRVPFDLVCTTNFDFLLERGYEKVEKFCRPIIDEEQLPLATTQNHSRNHEPNVTLLKFHGDLNHPNRVVATEEDYDGFLSRYPLISTYLANLLIIRTPLFIGYSIDDPDFRQIWQLIKDRLGSLRRPAYVLGVNVDLVTQAKFKRRGVNVINIPGKNYEIVYSKLFEELREYWVQNLPNFSVTVSDQVSAELALPRDARSRLCYFAIPYEARNFYISYIYPIVSDQNFTPVSFDEINAGDNIQAKEAAIIERAEIFIVDVESKSQLSEIIIALDKGKRPYAVLFIVPEGSEVPAFFINRLSKLEVHYERIIRSKDLLQQFDDFTYEFEKWFDFIANNLTSILEYEPVRLFEKREYNASIISAIILLESRLVQLFGDDFSMKYSKYKFRPMPLTKMVLLATEHQLISIDIGHKLREWILIRNKIVHERYSASGRTAKEVVYGIKEIVQVQVIDKEIDKVAITASDN